MNPSQERLAAALSDRYTIEKEVGAGGMATVFLAVDVKHGRKVALKVLRPELAAAMGGDRFPREIKFVAQFNHPHILSLYDSGEAQGFLYYVMPYVEGESLRDRLARDRQLSVHESVKILRDVTDALAYAHAHGVVHRDIKPGNVMLSGRHALVTDFGVAKALSASGGDKHTTVGLAVGTPQYMAPEQAMGAETIDHRVDIYALGVLGYEMLTGSPVFDAPTPQAVLKAHVMDAPRDIREVRAAIPAALADVIMRCLAKDPADRWHSAEDILTRLEMVQSTPSGGMTPTDTRPVAAVGGQRATGNGHRWKFVVGGAVGVAVAVTVLVLTKGGGASDRIDKIGVMPIEDISGKDSVFVAAMHDALTNTLARTGVGVAPRSVMMRYKGVDKTTRDIANENQLDAVVEATVFRAGDVMRISVQFSDPVTSKALWSDMYEKNVSNVLAAQSEVVAKVGAGIDSVLSAHKK